MAIVVRSIVMARFTRQLLLISQNGQLFRQLLRPILLTIRLLPLRKYFYPPLVFPLMTVIPLARNRVPTFSLVFPITLISNINEKTASLTRQF
jgi:hypothetical protein